MHGVYLLLDFGHGGGQVVLYEVQMLNGFLHGVQFHEKVTHITPILLVIDDFPPKRVQGVCLEIFLPGGLHSLFFGIAGGYALASLVRRKMESIVLSLAEGGPQLVVRRHFGTNLFRGLSGYLGA